MTLPVLNEINDQISQRRYRDAEQTHRSALKLAETQGTTFEDQQQLAILQAQIADGAQNQFVTAEANLDALIAAPLGQLSAQDWEAQTAGLLALMRDAALTLSANATLERATRRRENRLNYIRDEEQYQAAKEEIEAIWDRARRIVEAEPRTTVDTLLPIYEAAFERARQLQAAYPDNLRIAALRRRADERRNHLAGEEIAMTSGAQIGDYLLAFKHVESIEDADTVAVFDIHRNFIGQMSKEEALEELKRQTPIRVAELTGRYIDAADRYLRDFQPRLAQIELDRRQQYEALRQYVPQLYTPDRELEFRERELKIQQGIERLVRAEERAVEGAHDSLTQPLQGWRKYLEALDLYEGAVRSEKVKTARADILSQMERAIQRTQQDFKTRLAGLNSLNTGEVETEADQLIWPYDDLIAEAERRSADLAAVKDQSPVLQAQIDQYVTDRNDLVHLTDSLREQIRQARDQIGEIREISKRLNEIRALSVTNPRDAERELGALVADYSGKVEQDRSYASVRNEIDLRTNADNALTTYAADLYSTDIEQIEATIAKAGDAAEKISTHAVQFRAVKRQLEYWKDFVALDKQYTVNPEDTLRAMEALEQDAENEQIAPDLLDRLTARRKKLEEEHKKAANNNQLFENARTALKNGRPDTAFRELNKINPQNRTERAERDRLLAEARLRWQEQIVAELKALRLDEEFDRNQVMTMLEDLGRLDEQAESFWERELRNTLQAQYIRDLEEDEPGEARENWGDLIKSVSGTNLTYIRKRIRALDLRLQERRVTELEKKVRNSVEQVNDDPQATFTPDDEIIASIREVSDDLTRLIDRSEGIERVAALSNRVRALLTHVSYRVALLTLLERRLGQDGKMLVASYEDAGRIQESAIPDITSRLNEIKRLANQLDSSSKTMTNKGSDDSARIKEQVEKYARIGSRAGEVATMFSAMVGDLVFKRDQFDVGPFAQAAASWLVLETRLGSDYPEIEEWYNARVAWLRKEIQRELAALGTNPTSLALYWKLVALLMVLEPDSDFTKSTLKQMGITVAQIRQDLAGLPAQIVEGLPLDGEETGSSFAPPRPLLERQIAVLEDGRDGMSVIVFIVNRFLGDGNILTDARKAEAEARALAKALTDFRDLKNDFYNYLERGFVYNADPNAQSQREALLAAPNEVTRRWDRFTQKVGDLLGGQGQLLTSHPDVELARARYDEFKKRIQSLIDELISILDKVEVDQFEIAKSSVDTITDKKELFDLLRSSTLAEQFFVVDNQTSYLDQGNRPDPRGQTSRHYTGWREVSQYIKEQARQLAELQKWARPLGLPQPFLLTNQPVAGGLGSYNVKPVPIKITALIDWEAAKTAIEDCRASGQWQAALDEIMDVWYRANSSPRADHKLRIREALWEAANPPVVSDKDSPHRAPNDYDAAIRGVGSRLGVLILKWVQTNALVELNRLDREAKSLYDKLKADAETWSRLEGEYFNRLKEIATLQQDVRVQGKKQSLFRGERVMTASQKENGKIQRDSMFKTLTDMANLCPQHPELKNYKENPSLRWLVGALRN